MKIEELAKQYNLVPRQWQGIEVYIGNLPIGIIEPNKGQIKGLPANPRSWTKEALSSLKKSLKETPELFIGRGVICYPAPGADVEKVIALGGNFRLAAAKENNETELPVVLYAQEMSIEKLKEIVIKDNGSWGDWDMDMLGADWDDCPLRDWTGGALDWNGPQEATPENTATDDGYNAGEKRKEVEEKGARTQPGDIYLLGAHRLICGSSTDPDILAELFFYASNSETEEQADLLITDPPYNVNYGDKNAMLNSLDRRTSGGGGRIEAKIENDEMPEEDFQEFLNDAMSTAQEKLKAGGAAYVFMASSELARLILAFEAAGLQYKQLLIWVKNQFVVGRQDYQWMHEPCVYGWKEGASHYFTNSRKNTTVINDGLTEEDIDSMTKDEAKQALKAIFTEDAIPTTVFNYAKPSRNGEHPTMKPVPLIGHLIANSTRPGEIVLDTFGGSGTTLIACEQLGRRCRMVELDPVYCDVIVDRWQKLTGEEAFRIPGEDRTKYEVLPAVVDNSEEEE